MARYTLTTPHYLGDRYYAEGSVVDWDGPPSQSMQAADKAGERAVAERDAARKPLQEAHEVAMPGGEPPDPTWAPHPRPAFSVKTTRKPNPNDPDNQATIVRVPASAPSASSPGPTKGQTVVDHDETSRAADHYAKPVEKPVVKR